MNIRRLIIHVHLAAGLYLCAATSLAELGIDESATFTIDTRRESFQGSGVSATFTLDTRYSASSWTAFSGLFTVDTRGASPNPPELRISNVRASQRPGTGLVDIYYELGLVNLLQADVAVDVSVNGGVTFSIVPAPAALSGDVGAGIPSGQRTITWNAAATLPAQTFHANMVVRVTASVGSVSASAVSPRFTLDLPGVGGGLTVQGRILDAVTGQPLDGVPVSVGGQTAVTANGGRYNIPNVNLAAGNTVTVSQGGQTLPVGSVTPASGTTVYTPKDVKLPAAPPANKPQVTRLAGELDGLFLGQVDLMNRYTATVN